MLDDAFELHEFTPGSAFDAGPISVRTWLLPHWLPNAGLRLQAGRTALAYTGDTGPSPDLATLARDADLLIADASYPERVPDDAARRLVLTHLMPGTDPGTAVSAAAASYDGDITVAIPGLVAAT
jgi:ribonuclease BN (tRNA processing enzyme)